MREEEEKPGKGDGMGRGPRRRDPPHKGEAPGKSILSLGLIQRPRGNAVATVPPHRASGEGRNVPT